MRSLKSDARTIYRRVRAGEEQTTIHPRESTQPPNSHTNSSEVPSLESNLSHSVRDRFGGISFEQAKLTPPPKDLLKCDEPEFPETLWGSSAKETSLLAEEFTQNCDPRYRTTLIPDRRVFRDRVEALLQKGADPNITICKYEVDGRPLYRILGLKYEEKHIEGRYGKLYSKLGPGLLGRAASKSGERPRLRSLVTPFLESIVKNDPEMIVLFLRYGVNARDLVRQFTLINFRDGFEDPSDLISVSSRFHSIRGFVQNVDVLQDTPLQTWLINDLLETLRIIDSNLIVSYQGKDIFSTQFRLNGKARVPLSQLAMSGMVWIYSSKLQTGWCSHLRNNIARLDEEDSKVSASSVSIMCNMCQLVAGHRRLVNAYPVPRAMVSLALRHIQDTKKWEFISHVTGTNQQSHTMDTVPLDLNTIMSEISSFEDRDTGSLAAIALSKHWLISCAKAHVTCQSSDLNYVPTRLVEILDEGMIRIVEHISFSQKYTALSHRWSRDEASKTTSLNITGRLSPFRADRLSPTLRDSVKISRSLGYRYLWIDMLCIIQDSEQDWIHEAAEMRHVYSNAVITIAAECTSERDDDGIFRARDLKALKPFPLHELEMYTEEKLEHRLGSAVESGDKRWCIFPNRGGSQYTNRPKGVLDTRGWILQEQLLSPRILYFGHQQLYWDCISQSASELSPQGVSLLEDVDSGETWAFRLIRRTIAGKGDPRSLAKLIADVWKYVVENYSARTLTQQSDKLIALQGVIEALESVIQLPSVAGMWQQDLWKQLMWWCAGPPAYEPSERPSFPAPTWSWLSVMSAVLHHSSMRLDKDPTSLDDLAPLPDLRYAITNIRAEPTNVSATLDISALSFLHTLTAEDLRERMWKRWHQGKLSLAPARWMLDGELALPRNLQCVIIAEDEVAKMTVGMCLASDDSQPGTWKRVGVFLWEGLTWQIAKHVGQELQIGHFAVV